MSPRQDFAQFPIGVRDFRRRVLGRPTWMRYLGDSTERLDAALLVFLHVVRAAVDSDVLQQKCDVRWLKRQPTHLAVYMRTACATLAARGLLNLVEPLARCLLWHAIVRRPELVVERCPVVHVDGRRDGRYAVVFDWPKVLHLLEQHAEYLKPVVVPALLEDVSQAPENRVAIAANTASAPEPIGTFEQAPEAASSPTPASPLATPTYVPPPPRRPRPPMPRPFLWSKEQV